MIHANFNNIDNQAMEVYRVKAMEFRKEDYPNAATDEKGRLLCGAAVSTRHGTQERIDKLVQQDVDFLVIVRISGSDWSQDSSQGASIYQVELIKWIKSKYPDWPQVIGGNGSASNKAIPSGDNAAGEAADRGRR